MRRGREADDHLAGVEAVEEIDERLRCADDNLVPSHRRIRDCGHGMPAVADRADGRAHHDCTRGKAYRLPPVSISHPAKPRVSAGRRRQSIDKLCYGLIRRFQVRPSRPATTLLKCQILTGNTRSTWRISIHFHRSLIERWADFICVMAG